MSRYRVRPYRMLDPGSGNQRRAVGIICLDCDEVLIRQPDPDLDEFLYVADMHDEEMHNSRN